MTALVLPDQPLTEAECARLAALEAKVREGMATFVEVGTALMEIRDSRLYRTSHDVFEDYLRERWQISRPRGYELIAAAVTDTAMSAMADAPPIANERQARALAPILRAEGPERAAEVLRAAADSEGGVTARSIAAAAAPERVTTTTRTTESVKTETTFVQDDPRPAILEAEAARAREQLAALIEDDQDIQDARYRANLSRLVAQIALVPQFDPDRVAPLLDADGWMSLDLTMRALHDWHRRIARRRNPLKVIGE